jgi:hypothetical protein
MRGLLKFIKCRKSAAYTPLFVEEYNKVTNGLSGRLAHAVMEENMCEEERQRDLPNGHQYDEDRMTMYINQEKEETEDTAEPERVVPVPAAQNDLQVYGIAVLIVLLTGQIFGWIDCVMVICIAILLVWTLAQWTQWSPPQGQAGNVQVHFAEGEQDFDGRDDMT